MSLDNVSVRVETAPASGGAAGHAQACREARLRLNVGMAFLDGKKLRPLRNLTEAIFELDSLCVRLTWPGDPELRLRFADATALATFKASVESAQQRASTLAHQVATSPSSEAVTPPRSVQPVQVQRRPFPAASVNFPAAATPAPPPKRARRTTAGSGGILLREVEESNKKTVNADKDGDDDLPAPTPLVDGTLCDADRARRRALAAEMAASRAEAALQRGIGDVASAQRMRDRAERDELLGRVHARCAMRGQEVPWKLQGASLEELRAYMATE